MLLLIGWGSILIIGFGTSLRIFFKNQDGFGAGLGIAPRPAPIVYKINF